MQIQAPNARQLLAHSLAQRHGQREEGVGQPDGGKECIHTNSNHTTCLDLNLRQGKLHEHQQSAAVFTIHPEPITGIYGVRKAVHLHGYQSSVIAARK